MKNKQESAPMGGPGIPVVGARENAHHFDTFLRGQFRGLLQFLRARTASEQDAEDAAQESMTKLLRYRESEPPTAWKQLLYRIAVNVAHDQYRVALSHHNRDHVGLDGLEIATGEHTPEQRALYDQQVARLSKAILELPPKCQRVYLLKRVHGMSHAEIAKRCDISVKMVEKHLATALAQLRRKVGDSTAETS
ncbi:RNA polymerase sigma factor [Dyella flagellata]|nr:RNA polymerase sigma factor [Dyella flagellata]